MMDRVHAVLDGELPREVLSQEELARLIALESAVEEAARVLRAAPVPELSGRVMQALPPRPAVRQSAWERVRRWLWSPRELALTFRPAYALAGVAAAVLAGVLVVPRAVERAPAPVAEAPAPQRVYVQFRLDLADARRVELAGSFTGWEPRIELHQAAAGVWSVLVPLRPGVHDYTFVVDGRRWVPDPSAPQVADDFGGTNSRLFLPAPGERAI